MGSQSARSGSRRLPEIAYEREPGAAWLQLPRDYRRRKPENTALHIVMREHMETMFEEALRNPDSPGFPDFVKKDFERFLECGILAHGFSRLRCPSCGDEKLVAFTRTIHACLRTVFSWQRKRGRDLHPEVWKRDQSFSPSPQV